MWIKRGVGGWTGEHMGHSRGQTEEDIDKPHYMTSKLRTRNPYFRCPYFRYIKGGVKLSDIHGSEYSPSFSFYPIEQRKTSNLIVTLNTHTHTHTHILYLIFLHQPWNLYRRKNQGENRPIYIILSVMSYRVISVVHERTFQEHWVRNFFNWCMIVLWTGPHRSGILLLRWMMYFQEWSKNNHFLTFIFFVKTVSFPVQGEWTRCTERG